MLDEIIDKIDISNIWSGNGLIISLVGYVVVFASLVFLAYFITTLSKVLNRQKRKSLRKQGNKAAEADDISLSGELGAAIATALFMHYEEAHDIESTVLTIKKIQRAYSPWSSKLYGLRETPTITRIVKK